MNTQSQTAAQKQLAAIANQPHPSTRRDILARCREMPGATDTGYTERFPFADGSVLVYDHTANPGHEWTAE